VISFGAPLFDGWFGAGPVPGLMRGRPGAGSERAPYMVHVESNGSPTASRADRWIPIRPGTEAALALGLGRVLIGEGLAEGDVLTRAAVRQKGSQQEYAGLISSFTPEEAGRVTGVDPGLIRSTARELAARRPVIAVGGGAPGAGPLGEDEERAIWALNLLFGSVGRPGGVRLREDLAELFAERPCLPEESLWELPDGSLDLLLVDGSIPGTPVPADLLRRKLSGHGSLLVGMSPFIAGPTSEADIVLPTPAPGEWLDDVPPQALASRTSYGCSAAVVRPPEWACHGAEMLKRFLEAAGEESWPGTGEETIEQLIRGRIEALYAWGEGAVFDAERGETVDTTSIGSADRLAGILTRGGCWVEDADRAPRQATIRWSGSGWEMNTRIDEKALRLPAEPDGKEGKYPLLLILSGRLEVAGGGVLPPVTNKLYRESNLLLGARRAEVNSATAREHGLADRRPAELKTPYGTMEVTVVHDDSVMPGVIRMSPGPDPACFGDTTDRGPDVLDLCGASERPAWRVTRAMLREV
jgi:anaerobic selenocysteine-containing dehydrogenase